MNVHFSSERNNWKTPKKFFIKLDDEFYFNFDPCPPRPKFDGLNISWRSRNFVNPPYGREIGKWVKKAYEESCAGKLVVMLIPARTDTKWWHEYIMRADEIRFIKGRLQFDDCGVNAPFPSVIVVFRGRK